MKKFILPICLATFVAASAQDLRTEITVDRTVQPVLRTSTRLSGITPTIPAPQSYEVDLTFAEYTDPGVIDSEISILPAAAWSDSIPHTPYRGYASVGYLPLYNLEANAGYRFVDKKNIGVGLWLQYDGNSYNGDIQHFDGALFTNHNLTLGGNMGVKFTKNARFTGRGHATLKSIRTPYFYSEGQNEYKRSYNQSVKDLLANGRWSSRTGNLVYSLDGTVAYFALGDQRPIEIGTKRPAVKQAYANGTLSIGVAEDSSNIPWIGVDLEYGGMRSRDLPFITSDYRTGYGTEVLMQGAFKPFLRFDNDNGLEGRVGLNIGFGSGYHSKNTLSPDVHISWRPVSYVSLYAHVTGGNHLNLMSQLIEQNPYLNPAVAYGRTYMPMVARGGINVGPFDGMQLGIYGGYALARDYLSPLVTIERNGLTVSSMYTADVNSWYIGAHAGFAYQRLFNLGFDIKYGGADLDTHSWYEWMDAAKVVAQAALNITPSDPLEITISYDMRYQRKATSIVYPYQEISYVVYTGIPNLGTINSVNIGGSYRATDQVTAYIKIENLLNCHYNLISTMPAQGIHGLLGVAYKF